MGPKLKGTVKAHKLLGDGTPDKTPSQPAIGPLGPMLASHMWGSFEFEMVGYSLCPTCTWAFVDLLPLPGQPW